MTKEEKRIDDQITKEEEAFYASWCVAKKFLYSLGNIHPSIKAWCEGRKDWTWKLTKNELQAADKTMIIRVIKETDRWFNKKSLTSFLKINA